MSSWLVWLPSLMSISILKDASQRRDGRQTGLPSGFGSRARRAGQFEVLTRGVVNDPLEPTERVKGIDETHSESRMPTDNSR